MQISRIKVSKSSNYSQKNKTKDEKFDARCQLKSDKLMFGLEEEVTIPGK